MKTQYITVEKIDKEILICFTSYYGQNFIKALINKIKECNPQKVLYWTPEEWSLPGLYNEEDMIQLNDLLSEKNIKLYILLGFCQTNEKHLHQKNNKNHNYEIITWPTYFVHKITLNKIEEVKNFEYLFSSLNNNPHYHRCLLMDNLYKENLFEVGRISWNKIDNLYSGYDFKYWNQELMYVDNFNLFKIKRIYTDEYYKKDTSLISLVAESTTQTLFFTEKTFKPIFAERPFLILGVKGQNMELKKFGFELFEEIFDYEFDMDEVLENRTKGIVENLKNLKGKNYNDLYNIVRHKVKHNKKIALDLLKKDPYIPNEIVDLKDLYPDEFNKEIGQIIPSFFSNFM